MVKNSLYSAVSFRYMFLEVYKKLDLNEKEAMVILMVDHLLEQGNTLITNDALRLKMKFKTSEIDAILASLMQRNLLTYETTPAGLVTSIDNIKAAAFKEFQRMINVEDESLLSGNITKRLSSLVTFFEEKLGRGLSPLDRSTIGDWINAEFSDTEIKDALLDAIRSNKKNIRSVDKILRNKRRQEDIAREGASGVSETWGVDIEKTIEIAKSLWDIDDSK